MNGCSRCATASVLLYPWVSFQCNAEKHKTWTTLWWHWLNVHKCIGKWKLRSSHSIPPHTTWFLEAAKNCQMKSYLLQLKWDYRQSKVVCTNVITAFCLCVFLTKKPPAATARALLFKWCLLPNTHCHTSTYMTNASPKVLPHVLLKTLTNLDIGCPHNYCLW